MPFAVSRPAFTPYLSQRNGLANQNMNCVPTVLTMMVARFNPGLAGSVYGNSTAVIDAISRSMRSLDGSVGVAGLASYQTLGVLGRELGLTLQGRPGLDVNELAGALANGHHAMLIGDAYALPYATPAERALAPTADAGHVIAVTAYHPQRGAFVVHDPGHPSRAPVYMTPRALIDFVGYLNRDLDGRVGGSTIYVS